MTLQSYTGLATFFFYIEALSPGSYTLLLFCLAGTKFLSKPIERDCEMDLPPVAAQTAPHKLKERQSL